jgi:Na+/proline symporter
MSEWASPNEVEEEEVLGHVSVPFVVLASVLLGVGLFLVLTWLVTFQWAYIAGIPVLLAGFLLLFHRRAGLDAAE